MSDALCADSKARVASPSDDWVRVIQHHNKTGKYSARDICRILGNPVGGITVAAQPDAETSYRNAISR
jgi:hypothetical protein